MCPAWHLYMLIIPQTKVWQVDSFLCAITEIENGSFDEVCHLYNALFHVSNIV